MKWQLCGSETTINWGNSERVLCEEHADSGQGTVGVAQGGRESRRHEMFDESPINTFAKN
jgi:hypothetical protein